MPALTIIKGRRGTHAAWNGIVLAEGEFGYETDTGVFKVGDGATAFYSLTGINAQYLNGIESSELATSDHTHDGYLSSTDAATPKRTIFLSGAGGWTPNTSPDAGMVNTETSTNKVNFRGTQFSASASDTRHEFGLAMPANYDGGTITFRPYFYTTSTDASNHTIVFSLAGVAFADGGTMDTAYGTAQTSTETVASSIANKLIIGAESSAITIGGSPAGGNWTQFRLTRVGSDTHTGNIILVGVLISYTTDAYSDV